MAFFAVEKYSSLIMSHMFIFAFVYFTLWDTSKTKKFAMIFVKEYSASAL